ncbi:MAG: Smr/MutS family protein, partial [Bradyrhizobiaceae bacterium]|nr:Smr/MutS family protein [Bradyrhizobiaceae bacterium]
MSRPNNDSQVSGRPLRQDEDELWSAVTRSIKPLRPVKRLTGLHAGTVEPSPSHTALVRVRAASATSPYTSNPPPPLAPIGRRTRQRLARGSQSIDARIDLHGFTQGQAHGALMRFVRDAQASGMKFVLVITGKGRTRRDTAGNQGVLRREVPRWLKGEEFR